MLLTKYEQMKVVCMDYRNLYLYCVISWRCFSHVLFSGPFRWWWKAPQEDLQKKRQSKQSSETNRPSLPAKASFPAWLLGKSAGWIDKKAGTTLSRYRSSPTGTSETATRSSYIRTLLSYILTTFFLAGWLPGNINQINIFVWSIVHRSTHRCARRYWLAQPIGKLGANFHQWKSSESLSGRHTSVMQLAKEKIRYQSKIFQQY